MTDTIGKFFKISLIILKSFILTPFLILNNQPQYKEKHETIYHYMGFYSRELNKVNHVLLTKRD